MTMRRFPFSSWTTKSTKRYFSSSLSLQQQQQEQQQKLSIPTHLIFGANTDVGKTVVTAGLVRASSTGEGGVSSSCHYIKPLQCGGSDEAFVRKHASFDKNNDLDNNNEISSTVTTLFSWDTPTSPHVAARMENKPISDIQVLKALENWLGETMQKQARYAKDENEKALLSSHIWIETAGGVLSPSSSSPDNDSIQHAFGDEKWGWIPQADLYKTMTNVPPVILVGDGELGGISATLSSLESLLCRGYEVDGIVLIENGYSNRSAIQEYASRKCNPPFASKSALFMYPVEAIISLPALPPEPEPLFGWYKSPEVSETLGSFVHTHLATTWKHRNKSKYHKYDSTIKNLQHNIF